MYFFLPTKKPLNKQLLLYDLPVSRPVPEPQSQLHPPAETPLSLGSVESEDMGTVDNPLVIASEEELQGEDDEVTSAFSGESGNAVLAFRDIFYFCFITFKMPLYTCLMACSFS